VLRPFAWLGALALVALAIVTGCHPNAVSVSGAADLTDPSTSSRHPASALASSQAESGQATRAPISNPGHNAWAPRASLRWQVQLVGSVMDNLGANVYDLDPYVTATQTIADLRAHGSQTICHLDVGVADAELPDAPRLGGRLLGAPVAAADGSVRGRWLDIRQWARIAPVLSDRLELCRAKGFQAVDADFGDGYAHATGFPLTESDQLTFDRRVAVLAHQGGLAVGVRTTAAVAASLQPSVDFAVVADCFGAGDCSSLLSYVAAGKAVFDVEASTSGDVCPLARTYGITASLLPTPIDMATSHPC
jgi:hypothetical protein